MSKKEKKKKRPERPGATPQPATSGDAAPLEARTPWRREPKPEKISAKERSAIAKKAARARLMKGA